MTNGKSGVQCANAATSGGSRQTSLGPSSIPSLGDGVMVGSAWIDRPVDTQGCAPASTSSLAQHGCAAMPKPNNDIPVGLLRETLFEASLGAA
jgi:hypothetical protein